MTRPLSILAFVPTLGGGGAEKHVERIANAVDRSVATIDIATVRAGGSFERFLSPSVRLVALSTGSLGSGTADLAAAMPGLRREMRSGRYDATIAFLERPTLAALLVASSIPRARRSALLISVQADPVSVVAQDPLGPAFAFAMRHLYRHADGVIAISDGVRDALRTFDPSLDPQVVPNACVDEALRESIRAAPTRTGSSTIVACGRLSEQKGFDVLIDALADVRRAIPDATLRIVGTGPLEADLRDRASSRGVERAVTFVGFLDDPVRELASAEVFCLSSRFEGLGMVVVEAMAAGTPVVATDCPHGPREILAGGVHGDLVPRDDAPALAEALIRMLRDAERRRRFSASGRIRAEDYAAERIARAYVDVVRRSLRR